MPLPYSVEQISSRLVSCLWFWRLQPHKKKLVKLTCANSFRSFWWPRGSQRRSTVTSRGCGAATGWTVRYFRKDQRPVQDFLRSEVAHSRLGQTRFLIKNHTKARGLYKCIHQLLIKERIKTTVFFKFLTALILLEIILTLWQISFLWVSVTQKNNKFKMPRDRLSALKAVSN